MSGFDSIVPFYDFFANILTLGAITRAQTWGFDNLPKGKKVLILGGGTGKILKKVFDQLEPIELLFVDTSSKMLEKAREKAEGYSKGAIHFSDASNIENIAPMVPEGGFDIVFTPFYLDLFEDSLEHRIKEILKVLNKEGYWHFSDFNIPPKGLIRLISSLYVWSLYRFFKFFCGIEAAKLGDFETHLKDMGLRKKAGKQFLGGMIRSGVFLF